MSGERPAWAADVDGRPTGLDVSASRATGIARESALMAELGHKIQNLSSQIAKDLSELEWLRERYAERVADNLAAAQLLAEEQGEVART